MKGVPSFNDEWFKTATKEEVNQIYKGKLEHGQALEHWKKFQKRTSTKAKEN